MGKKRTMKHAVPLTEFQERMFDFIESSFTNDTEPLTEQKLENFWNQFQLQLYEQEGEALEKEKSVHMTTEVKCDEENLSEETLFWVMTLRDFVVHMKNFLNANMHILFVIIMSLNIIWMQLLYMNYEDIILIQLVKWGMILSLIIYLLILFRSYRKTRAHHKNEDFYYVK